MAAFERFAEQISSTFADHGHQVTVYCRRAFTRPDDVYDKRVRRVIVPSLHQKHLDTWVSSFFAAVHVAFSDNDVVLLCNVANSPFAYIPRLFGKPVVLNVDGLDRKREKWKGLGAQVLHFCEWMSSFSSSQLVTDAKAIHDYYLAKYKSESVVIGYGSEMPAGDYNLNGLNLEPGRYVLYVSRLEPENNPDLVLRSWRNIRSDWPLVMVGDNPYDTGYIERLKSLGDERVRFTGAIYGDGYWALQKHAGIFVFACEIGGVHPALIEAMAASNPVRVSRHAGECRRPPAMPRFAMTSRKKFAREAASHCSMMTAPAQDLADAGEAARRCSVPLGSDRAKSTRRFLPGLVRRSCSRATSQTSNQSVPT